MVNRVRGEAKFVLNGKSYKVALTFGALADLQDEFGLKGLDEIEKLFPEGHVDAKVLMRAVRVLINANPDNPKVKDEDLRRANVVTDFAPLFTEFMGMFKGGDENPPKAAKVSPGKA